MKESVGGALVDRIAAGCQIGRCPVWDERRQELIWTDVCGKELLIHSLQSGRTTRVALPEMLFSFGLTEAGDQLIGTFETGLALLHMRDGTLSWLHRRSARMESFRLCGGGVDRQGRFWVNGSLFAGSASAANDAALYNLSAEDGVRRRRERGANGICWSPGGAHMYVADTPARSIFVFDFDIGPGKLSNKRLLAVAPPGSYPADITTDVEGRIWCALWGAASIACYGASGKMLTDLYLPARQPSGITFGGPDRDRLYVTTAQYGAERISFAGDVFVFLTDTCGQAEPVLCWSAVQPGAARQRMSAPEVGVSRDSNKAGGQRWLSP